MGKFHGVVGYAKTEETAPGVFSEGYIEKEVAGDVLSSYISQHQGTDINDNITLNTRFSVIASSFMLENLHFMKYLVYRGVKWHISGVDDTKLPRIIINIGGVYNEEPS